MKLDTRVSTIVLGLGLTACGGSDLDPGAGDSAGTGTATLVVDGSVSANPRLTNAQAPGDFDTELSVRVSLNNAPVTTGVVTLTSASGTVTLTFQPAGNGQDNRWRGSAPGYDEVYILDVDSGADNVHDVRVDGPDIHTFQTPTAGATVDATMPLDVKWSRDDEADSTEIDTEELDHVAITDSGDYALTANALKSKKDQAQENRITVTRTNRVTPRGAAGGSELSVSVENRIDVVAMPNPLAN